MRHFKFLSINLKYQLLVLYYSTRSFRCKSFCKFYGIMMLCFPITYASHVRMHAETTRCVLFYGACAIHAALTLNSKQHNLMCACQVSKCLTFLSWLLDGAWQWTSEQLNKQESMRGKSRLQYIGRHTGHMNHRPHFTDINWTNLCMWLGIETKAKTIAKHAVKVSSELCIQISYIERQSIRWWLNRISQTRNIIEIGEIDWKYIICI